MVGQFDLIPTKWLSCLSKSRQHTSKLLEMPLDIVNKVFEKLEPVDLLVLRKVCQCLRAAVDKFTIHLHDIRIICNGNKVFIKLNESCFEYSRTTTDGTKVSFNEKIRILENESYMDIAANDLGLLLKHVSRLYFANYVPKIKIFITSFINVSKTKKCINVRSIELGGLFSRDVQSILRYLDVRKLDDIILWRIKEFNQLERLQFLDQWKSAKTFQSWHLPLKEAEMKIEQFFHFNKFKIKLENFSIENAVKIRDDLLRRRSFQYCCILFETINSITLFDLKKVFQPDASDQDEHQFEYSIHNNKFHIFISDGHFMCSISE